MNPRQSLLSNRKNRLIIGVCAVLIVALIGVLIFVLIRKHSTTASSDSSNLGEMSDNSDLLEAEISEDSPEFTPGLDTEGDDMMSYDEAIAADRAALDAAASPEEAFEAKLTLIQTLIAAEHYEEALSLLDAIDPNAISANERYMYANVMTNYYMELDDYDMTNKYRAMSAGAYNEMHAAELE